MRSGLHFLCMHRDITTCFATEQLPSHCKASVLTMACCCIAHASMRLPAKALTAESCSLEPVQPPWLYTDCPCVMHQREDPLTCSLSPEGILASLEGVQPREGAAVGLGGQNWVRLG